MLRSCLAHPSHFLTVLHNHFSFSYRCHETSFPANTKATILEPIEAHIYYSDRTVRSIGGRLVLVLLCR
jgi:hypothetical protein